MSKKIAVISAQWHADIVESAEQSFIQEMIKMGYDADLIDVIKVPGALEIPLIGQRTLTDDYDLAVGISFIVNGSIYWPQYVAQAVVDGIVNVSLKTNKPFISVSIAPQAFSEASPENEKYFIEHFVIKGAEAASAADTMLKLSDAT